MNDLRIVNLSTYTTPDIVEKSNKDWVSYGADNNYFNNITSYNNSEVGFIINSSINNIIMNSTIANNMYGMDLRWAGSTPHRWWPTR